MRALIRGTEICLENAWTKWQRMNMLFLTGKEKDADGNPLPGDGWTLVEDYHESADGEVVEDAVHDSARAPVEGTEEPEPIQSTPVEEKLAEQPSEALPETVTYGGKEYTLEELKKLIQ